MATVLRPEPRETLARLLGPGPPVLCAPMVRGSELAFRMLVREHGVRVCYTPMLKVEHLLLGYPEERRLVQEFSEGDRPLVAQFGGRDAEALARGVREALAARPFDAVDLNLGCPQHCAKEGRYGAFLMEEPDVAAECVEAMCQAAAPVPVFCKTRICRSREASVAFARRLEAAGCAVLAVHCRLREAERNGEPDFEHLRAIVAAVGIPVVANGAVASLAQARAVMEATGAAAVMSGTGLLQCPRAFVAGLPAALADLEPLRGGLAEAGAWALEYLDFAERFPVPDHRYLSKHLRWIFTPELREAYQESKVGWQEAREGRGATGTDWRACAWTFLAQPYLTELWQFRELVRLMLHLAGAAGPGAPVLSFHEIRYGPGGEDTEPSLEWLDL